MKTSGHIGNRVFSVTQYEIMKGVERDDGNLVTLSINYTTICESWDSLGKNETYTMWERLVGTTLWKPIRRRISYNTKI